ncbi:ester cyclase [Frankia sp. Cas4]|uniref:ester cyclase n=1 Tax=Frankia sp. Cas4 TaxID=3073927 RepID=UPI002AD48591|nr:ester cyclase [Frankia sp. Cas4]
MTTTTNTATTDTDTNTNTTPEAKLRARREAIVRTHMEAEGRHDVAATLNTFAEANYDVVALGAPTNGPQAVEELLTMLFGAFPDFAAEALSIHHGDDIVFVDTWMAVTHHGPWAGVPATGRPIDVRCGCVFHFDGDRLVKETVSFDHATLLGQIGVSG